MADSGTIYLCLCCDKQVFDHHQAIECDACKGWQHRGCNTGKSFISICTLMAPTYIYFSCYLSMIDCDLVCLYISKCLLYETINFHLSYKDSVMG